MFFVWDSESVEEQEDLIMEQIFTAAEGADSSESGGKKRKKAKKGKKRKSSSSSSSSSDEPDDAGSDESNEHGGSKKDCDSCNSFLLIEFGLPIYNRAILFLRACSSEVSNRCSCTRTRARKSKSGSTQRCQSDVGARKRQTPRRKSGRNVN